MMRPLTKLSRQIVDANLIVSTVQEAFKISRDERPGAVHLELPEDIAADLVPNPPVVTPLLTPRRPIAENKAIAQAIKLIESAKHPLLLIGAGANRKRVSKMLNLFVDKTSIPFFTTQMGKGVISENHPQYLGTAALSAADYLHEAVALADLIINVGHDTIEKPPFLMSQVNPQTVLHLNFSPAIPDPIYRPQLEVIGDIANAIWQITEAITPSPAWDFSPFKQQIDFIQASFTTTLDSGDPETLSPYHIIQSIRAELQNEDIVTLDNGMYKLWFARHYPAFSPNTLLLDNALATMGAGLSSAMAAKLLNPDKTVVAVCGDGGFMMNSAELETAKRLGLDLVVIVLTDNTYGMIDWKQSGMQLPHLVSSLTLTLCSTPHTVSQATR
jgi:acetolactate synthase-1/2/3 large subunit